MRSLREPTCSFLTSLQVQFTFFCSSCGKWKRGQLLENANVAQIFYLLQVVRSSPTCLPKDCNLFLGLIILERYLHYLEACTDFKTAITAVSGGPRLCSDAKCKPHGSFAITVALSYHLLSFVSFLYLSLRV